jgi:hypothetical protein
LFLAALPLACAAAADHRDLNGRWQLDAAQSPDGDRLQSETLAITQKADSIAISDVITDSNGKRGRPISSATPPGREWKLKAQSAT